MATQQGPPSRPWFRLATMARPPAPAPQPDQPAPPPTRPPAFVRPAFTQPPPPPQPPRAAPPPPPTLPREPRPMPSSANPRTSPLQPATSPQPPRSTAPPFTANTAPTFNRATSSPPKTVKPPEKTPPSSPDIKPLSRPPSPLALPSPQLKSYQPPEYDQKSVLVQEKPKAQNYNGDLRRNMARDTNNPINGVPKKPEASKNHHLESEDLGMTIITISGENKGAIMDLTTPSVNNKTHHKFGNNPNSLNPTASSDGEKSGSNSDSKSKGKKNKNQKSKSPLMSTAVMNSNVQAVNNSILYNCSTTHHDPGIHLSLSRKPTGARGFFPKDQKDHIN